MQSPIQPTILRRTGSTYIGALAIAAVFTVLSVLQLFWYEEFIGRLALLLPAGVASFAPVVAAFIVIAEILAITYFLPLALSKLARTAAALLAVVAPIVWLVLLTSTLAQQRAATTTYLGSAVDGGLVWWSVLPMLVLLSAVVALIAHDTRSS